MSGYTSLSQEEMYALGSSTVVRGTGNNDRSDIRNRSAQLGIKMITLHDFFGLGVWFIIVMTVRTSGLPLGIELKTQDRVFVALCVLVVVELVWLRVGYPAP